MYAWSMQIREMDNSAPRSGSYNYHYRRQYRTSSRERSYCRRLGRRRPRPPSRSIECCPSCFRTSPHTCPALWSLPSLLPLRAREIASYSAHMCSAASSEFQACRSQPVVAYLPLWCSRTGCPALTACLRSSPPCWRTAPRRHPARFSRPPYL